MNIRLCKMTKAKMYTFFKNFSYDTMVLPENNRENYMYNPEKVNAYYDRNLKAGKLHYAIMLGNNVIGDIYLKHISISDRSCELGIHMVNDYYKGKGYGTQALYVIQVMAHKELEIEALHANTSADIRGLIEAKTG